MNNQQMQLYAVNFIPLLGSLYMFRVFYTPIIRSTILKTVSTATDRLYGLVVRDSGYRYRDLGFDSRRYQIFWVVMGLERGPLSLVMSIEELLE